MPRTPNVAAATAELWEALQWIEAMEKASCGTQDPVLSPDDVYFLLSHIRLRLAPVLRHLGGD